MAIKQLNKGTSDEQTINFLSEIGIIAHVNHPNTAKLIGYGVEGGTYLVLKLSSLGSLGSLLRGMFSQKFHFKFILSWELILLKDMTSNQFFYFF